MKTLDDLMTMLRRKRKGFRTRRENRSALLLDAHTVRQQRFRILQRESAGLSTVIRHPSARDQSPLIRLCIGFDFGICSSVIAKSSFQDQQYAASMTQLSSNSSASNPEIPKLSKINPKFAINQVKLRNINHKISRTSLKSTSAIAQQTNHPNRLGCDRWHWRQLHRGRKEKLGEKLLGLPEASPSTWWLIPLTK